MNELLQWAKNCLSGVVDASTLVRDALLNTRGEAAREAANSIEQAYAKLSGERYAALSQGAIAPQQFQEDCLNFLTALERVAAKAELDMGEKFKDLMGGVRSQVSTIPTPGPEAEPPKPQPQAPSGPPPILFIVGLLGMAGLGYWAYRKISKEKPKPTLAERLEAEDNEGDAFDGLEEYEDVEGDKPEEMVDPHEEGGITIVKG